MIIPIINGKADWKNDKQILEELRKREISNPNMLAHLTVGELANLIERIVVLEGVRKNE